MQSYSPEEFHYLFEPCWTVDRVADLMAQNGLERVTLLDILKCDRGVDVKDMARRMTRDTNLALKRLGVLGCPCHHAGCGDDFIDSACIGCPYCPVSIDDLAEVLR